MNLSEWLDSSDLEDVIRRSQVDVAPLEPPAAVAPALPARSTPSYPGMTDLKEIFMRLRMELYTRPEVLLQLNRSRREAIHHHLRFLLISKESVPETLEAWIRDAAQGTHPALSRSLELFFEETALVWLAQALILKAWEEKGLRPFSLSDLREPSYQLYQQLLPKMVGSKPWQITQSNFYSWFRPSNESQSRLFEVLTGTEPVSRHGSIVDIILALRSNEPHPLEVPELDARFISTFWEFLGRRRATKGALAFSPTLRLGNWVRNSPSDVGWVGLEWNLFRLLMAEASILERSLQSAPLWLQGTGLELFSKDQLELGLTSPRNVALGRLCELECFDFAFVLEEKVRRADAKNLHAEILKNYLAQFPHLKNLVSSSASLGGLQALIALTKVRPGGCFAWLRSEPLSPLDGQNLLQQFLGKAALLGEWSFADIEHQLPTKQDLFPRFLYVFRREIDPDKRREHLPVRIRVRGHLRSHVDVVPMLEEAFRALEQEPPEGKAWKTIRHLSPIPQSEWAHRWPEVKDQDMLESLDRLREQCIPLGQIVQVRALSSRKEHSDEEGSLFEGTASNVAYIGLSMEGPNAGRALRVQRAIDACSDASGSAPGNVSGRGSFDPKAIVHFPSSAWYPALRFYLESDIASSWLAHFCEQRNGHFTLKEATLRNLPFPKAIQRALVEGPTPSSPELDPLLQSQAILERLRTVDPASDVDLASIFLKTAETLSWIEEQEGQVRHILNADGTIRWSKGLELLPKRDLIPFRLHSEVQVVGLLPPQVPIVLAKPVQSPRPGIWLSTENHLSAQIAVSHPMAQEMLLSQLLELDHPTWSEINQKVLLPKNLDLATQTASEVLQFIYEQRARIGDLEQLLRESLGRCLKFKHARTPS